MTTRSRYTAAITDKPWWLAGGVEKGICIAAYKSKGAESYAASKLNLVDNGTFPLVENTTVSWSDSGWYFNGAEYFSTGIYPTIDYSFICYHDSPLVNRYSFGSSLIGQVAFGAASRNAININGTIVRVEPPYKDCVTYYSAGRCAAFSFLTQSSFIEKPHTGTFSGTDPYPVLIGGHYLIDTPADFSTGFVLAFAVYKGGISTQQAYHIAQRLFIS